MGAAPFAIMGIPTPQQLEKQRRKFLELALKNFLGRSRTSQGAARGLLGLQIRAFTRADFRRGHINGSGLTRLGVNRVELV